MLSVLAGTWIQFGNSLRILSRFYRAHRLAAHMRPASAAARNESLDQIVAIGWWNPLTQATPEGWRATRTVVTDPLAWEMVGLTLINRWTGSYPSIVRLHGQDADNFEADARDAASMATGTTMGAVPVAVPIILAVGKALFLVAVGIGVAVAIRMAVIAGANFVGADIEYRRALIEEMVSANDCCLHGATEEERQRCCARADRIADRIESYKPPILAPLKAITVGAGAFLGGWALWKLARSKGLVAKAKTRAKALAGQARKRLPGGKT
jgi:hypothetical protein